TALPRFRCSLPSDSSGLVDLGISRILASAPLHSVQSPLPLLIPGGNVIKGGIGIVQVDTPGEFAGQEQAMPAGENALLEFIIPVVPELTPELLEGFLEYDRFLGPARSAFVKLPGRSEDQLFQLRIS